MKTYNIYQSWKKLSLDETENPDNKIVINKYDNKIQKLKFITDATLPPRLYCAFKKPSSLNEYFIIPLTKDNEIIIGTDISSYDGRWDMILIGTSNDYVIEGNDIDQSKLTYVSDTFTRLLVRDNFLNELDSGEHTSPTFDILYDEFRDDIEGKVNLPKDSNGNLDYGTDGQIGVSDGNGGIKWIDKVEADEELSTESENPIQNKVVTKEINDLKKDIETKQEKGDYALKSDIPTVLPNPKSLRFTGAVEGTYDGSEEEVVDIPTVTIDTELSNTSENPVQNKAIKKELDKFGGTIEITSEEPKKEGTVLTINQASEEINIYTAKEVDEKLEYIRTLVTEKVVEILKTLDLSTIVKIGEGLEIVNGELTVTAPMYQPAVLGVSKLGTIIL